MLHELAITALLFFLLCALIGSIGAWASVRLSHLLGIYDNPGGRKVHRKPMPYLGGLGFAFTVVLGTAIFSFVAPQFALIQQPFILAFLIGLLAIFLVGFWDDVAGMSPFVKLGLQIVIAVGMWFAGIRIERVTLGFGGALDLMAANPDSDGLLILLLASLPSLLLTVGWYVALMNAINLIDGLDGLAGGVSLIAALSLGIVGLGVTLGIGNGITFGQVLPFIAGGALLGFLTQNWHPAKIFMGDAGSLSIGYVLATASMLSSTKAPALVALMVPLVALALPLFETTFSFARRLLRGQNPFKADRRHLHHRLLDAGLNHQRVVLIFLYTTTYFGINAILISQSRSPLLLLNVFMIGVGLMMLIEYLKYFEKKRLSEDKNLRENQTSPTTLDSSKGTFGKASP
ncbi:MAG: MraY family glycosyltransferase [Candidatus Sumerlaeia bacterium]|nr:MraY family glycosyltransferase [Candidatus Sumerlaeia bacterium]